MLSRNGIGWRSISQGCGELGKEGRDMKGTFRWNTTHGMKGVIGFFYEYEDSYE